MGFSFTSHPNERPIDYNLVQYTGKFTTQERGFCFAHAFTNFLEAELKTQNLLEPEEQISPEGLEFIYYVYPQVGIKSREPRFISDYAKRTYNGDQPLNEDEKTEVRNGGFGASLMSSLPETGFCLEVSLERVIA